MRAGTLLVAALLLGAALAACAQFGVPRLPDRWRDAERLPGTVFLVYDARTVLGFGHTGVVVEGDVPGAWLRFDQYASAEIAYGGRLRAGTAGFWDPVTARLPSIFGATREYVTRRESAAPAALLAGEELLLPMHGLNAGHVRAAAQARFEQAGALEQESAPRYFWTANNCQHFVRDVLRAGGPIPERYFPKWMVEDLIEASRPK
jgi:hypothetical protein